MTSGFWTMEKTAALGQLRADGLSYTHAAKALGCSRNAACAKAWRMRRPRTAKPATPPTKRRTWSESALTETWADRKARRMAERAA